VDNTIDILLPSTDAVKRAPLGGADWLEKEKLVAEHGFAALVAVSERNTAQSLLFDAGLSKRGLVHNMDVLEVRAKDIRAVVLSHGHADHTQGLMGMLERVGKRRMPLGLHPDAFLRRKVVFPDGHEINLPPPDRALLSHEGIEFIEAEVTGIDPGIQELCDRNIWIPMQGYKRSLNVAVAFGIAVYTLRYGVPTVLPLKNA